MLDWRTEPHLVLLGINVVHIVYDPPFEIMPFAPDTRHHHSRIFTEFRNRHYLLLAWFGLFSAVYLGVRLTRLNSKPNL